MNTKATHPQTSKSPSADTDVRNPHQLSPAQFARICSIDSLAHDKRKETLFLLHAVGLLDAARAIPYDIGQETFNRVMASGVLPKYVNVGGTTYRRTPRGRARSTLAHWSTAAAQNPLRAPAVTDEERELLRRILENYVHAPRKEYLGPSEVLSTAEILDAVGVDVPTAGQLGFAESIIRERVGVPKLVAGELKFHVNVCDDGQWPDLDMVQMYPVPRADWTFCNYLIDQSTPERHVSAIAGAGQKPLNVGALIY